MVRKIEGAGFAFIPRSLVVQPSAFGLVPDLLAPKDGQATTDERYRAAMMQHLMCFAARMAVRREFGTSPALHVKWATQPGLGEDRVRRVFRGATMAQFTDFAFWAAKFPEVGQVVSEYVASWAVPPSNASAGPDSEPPPQGPATEVMPQASRSFTATPPLSRFEPTALQAAPAKRRTTPQNPYG